MGRSTRAGWGQDGREGVFFKYASRAAALPSAGPTYNGCRTALSRPDQQRRPQQQQNNSNSATTTRQPPQNKTDTMSALP